MRFAVTLIALTMVGCSTQIPAPPAVQIMPNDCGNQLAIFNWYKQQAAVPKHPLESAQDYERRQAEVKKNIWTLRYHCQPV